MLSQDIIKKINNKEIKSRRHLYRLGIKRSKKLIRWLDENNLLIPKKWTKERFEIALKKEVKRLNRIPKATENHSLCDAGKRLYGSWNNALLTVLGSNNQNRYNLTKDSAKKIIYDFVKKNQRLPLRQEFNGNKNPYWESITTILEVSKWSDIFKEIDLTNISYFNNSYHGTGKIHWYKQNIFLSHQEYLIGKYLIDNNIKFEKEVPYKNSNYVFDFYLPEYNIYIEYYGRSNHNDYKQNIDMKRSFYDNRNVIEIFKHDNTVKKLDEEVQRL